MVKKEDKRKKKDDDFDSHHVYKIKQSNQHRKMYRNIDNVLKKKDLRELINLEYDDYK